MAAVNIEELVAERDELKARVAEIDAEHAGERFTDEVKDEWNRLNSEIDEYEARIAELELRKERIEILGTKESAREELSFQTARASSGRTENIYDLSTVRRSYDDPAVEASQLKDRALRAIDGAVYPHPEAARISDVKGHVEKLAEKLDSEDGRFSRYVLATNNPAYRRAFPKLLMPNGAAMLTREEQSAVSQAKYAERALSLTTSAGGYAVPFTLDPSIVPTSNLAVNPFRAISRVEQITTDEWNGVSSAGITASWDAEAAEVSDDAPTLAQPNIPVYKAAAFVPFSLEIGQDWSSIQSEMAMLIQDAKDELEATAFATGSGSAQPTGVITGATSTVSAATGGAFALADVYAMEAALGPRFRTRADWVMNRTIAQKIRQFDTAGGAQLWQDNLRVGLENQVPTPGSYGPGANLLGYGAYESSAMSSTLTTGQKVLVLGDFSRYFLIADRVGLNLEYIPHLFHTSNNRPSGSRGIYAYWRTGSNVLSTAAFKVLQL